MGGVDPASKIPPVQMGTESGGEGMLVIGPDVIGLYSGACGMEKISCAGTGLVSMPILACSWCSSAAVDSLADFKKSSMLIESRSLDERSRVWGRPTNDEAELARRWSMSDASLTLCRSCMSLP